MPELFTFPRCPSIRSDSSAFKRRADLKESITKALSWGLSKTGANALLRKTSKYKVAILCWKRILPSSANIEDYPAESSIAHSDFVDQVRFLERHYEVIGLREYCRRFLTGDPFENKAVVLTFDGGYRDIFDRVALILEDLNLPATAILPTGLIGTFDRMFEDRLLVAANAIIERRGQLMAEFPDEGMPETCSFVINLLVSNPARKSFIARFLEKLAQMPFAVRKQALEWFEQLGQVSEAQDATHLTWAHVNGLVEMGWELGSLGVDGSPLAGAEAASVESTMLDSFRTIQQNTRQAPVALAYPAGLYDERLVRIGRKAGFLCGVTEHPGYADAQQDLFALPRVMVNRATAPDAKRLETLLSFLK